MKDREALNIYLAEQFPVEQIKVQLTDWIRHWFSENGPESVAVVGLSGGKDSTVVATLCREALGKNRVFGVLMPNHVQADLEEAKAVAQWLQIPYEIVNIGEATDAMWSILQPFKQTQQMKNNLPPRIRMTTLYAIAQSKNGRVSNNSNRSERYVGYATIFGDAAGDFSPLRNLTVTEVVALGRSLGIPEKFIAKAPSDGLTGKTDEDNFGFTYEELDSVILTGSCEREEALERIKALHERNAFKQNPMQGFELK